MCNFQLTHIIKVIIFFLLQIKQYNYFLQNSFIAVFVISNISTKSKLATIMNFDKNTQNIHI